MSKVYPLVPLGEVIRHRKEFVEIDDIKSYKRCRVQLHAQGIVLRDTVQGVEIRTKKQQICKYGDFLVAEIDAKVGGFGIVPESLDGAIVSSHYFLFGINDALLNRRFLDFFIQTPAFRNQVAAQGSTNYAAIRPNDVLGYQLPLPPLEEQRRIVARVEVLAGKIGEARSLRQQAAEETKALLSSVLHKVFVDEENTWTQLDVGSVGEIIDPNPSHRMPHYAEQGIPFISTVDFEGEETIRRKTVKYVTEETYKEQLKRCSFAVGDILYSRIGTIGQARILTEVWPFALSHVLVVVKPNKDILLPRFLLWYFRSDSIVTQAANATRSIGVPDLGIKRIRGFHIPVPPLPEQHRIVAYLDSLQVKIDEMKRLREEARAELDALLPAILDKAFRGEL